MLIHASPLVVFGTDDCPYCHAVEDSLKRAGLKHASHTIGWTERAALRHLTAQRTIPYVFVHGTFVGGCNDGPEPWMGTLPLIRSGRLQAMLYPDAPPPPPLAALVRSMAHHPVVIIGGGIGALTAALYLARAERQPLVLGGEPEGSGGQLMLSAKVCTAVPPAAPASPPSPVTHTLSPTPSPFSLTSHPRTLSAQVDNFPGFPAGVSGRELMAKLEKQAIRAGASLAREHVVAVERAPTADHPAQPAFSSGLAAHARFVLRTAVGRNVTVGAVVVASGASARWLHLDGEEQLRGRHLHTCARCDARAHLPCC